MTTILVVTTRSLAAVKAHFRQVIDEIAGTHERVIVTKNGNPVAVILAVEDYESLMETLEVLSDPTAVVDFPFGPLAADPHRVGTPLRVDLEGLWSARRGQSRAFTADRPGGHMPLPAGRTGAGRRERIWSYF